MAPMWKNARHVWFSACMCLLHPTLASFSTWPGIISVRGCAIPPSQTIRHIHFPIYGELLHQHAAAYIRVQLLTYTRPAFQIQRPFNTLPQYIILINNLRSLVTLVTHCIYMAIQKQDWRLPKQPDWEPLNMFCMSNGTYVFPWLFEYL